MSDPEVQLKRNIENAAKNSADVLKQSKEKILADIFFYSKDLLSQFPNDRVTNTIAHFSALLVKLSEDADKLQKRIFRLSWAMFILSVAMLVLASTQLFVQINQIPSQKNDYTQQYNNIKDANDKQQPTVPSKAIPKMKQHISTSDLKNDPTSRSTATR
ncbi:MAG: hypothetical protein WC539_01070 [Nitrospirota bacterium]